MVYTMKLPDFVKGSTVEPITCQGIFRWNGQQYERISVKRPYKLLDFRRERKIFFALNIPYVQKLSDKELADQIIINLVLDEGLESPFIILDPQKQVGGFMSPQTEQEQTDNPGQCTWIGWMPVPGSARFSDPGPADDPIIHNLTVMAAFRDVDFPNERNFTPAYGACVQKYEFRIVDNYRPD